MDPVEDPELDEYQCMIGDLGHHPFGVLVCRKQEELDFLCKLGLAVGKGSLEGFKALQGSLSIIKVSISADLTGTTSKDRSTSPSRLDDHLQGSQSCADAVASGSHILGHETKSPAQSTRKQPDVWTQVPLGNRGRQLLSPFYHQLLLNGKVSLDTNAVSAYDKTPPPSQNGFSVSYGPKNVTCNSNEKIRAIAKGVRCNSNETITRMVANVPNNNVCSSNETIARMTTNVPNNNVCSSNETITKTITMEATSIPLDPLTPNKCQGIKDELPLEKRAEKAVNFSTELESFQTCFGHGVPVPSNNSLYPWLSQIETQEHDKYRGYVIDFNKHNTTSLAPVTPDKCKQVLNTPNTEVIDLVDNSDSERNDVEETDINYAAKGIQRQSQSEDELYSQGIDLNKTPQKKPKKRKHRPKVIREVGATRKANHTTLKSVGTTETPTKRKYTCRKDVSTMETPSSGIGETSNPAKKRSCKSVKRSLHFDSEVAQEGGRSQPSESLLQYKQGSQDHNEGMWNMNGHSQWPDVVEQSTSGFAANLDHTTMQVSEKHAISLETEKGNGQATRRTILRENLQSLATFRDMVGITCKYQSSLPAGSFDCHEFPPNSKSMLNGYSTCHYVDGVSNTRELQRNCDHGSNNVHINSRDLIMGNPQIKKICSDRNGRGEHLQSNETRILYPMLNKQREENGGSKLASNAVPFQSPSYKNVEHFNTSEKSQLIYSSSDLNRHDQNKRQPPKAPIQVCNFSSLISGISCGKLPLMSKLASSQSQTQIPANREALPHAAVTPMRFPRIQENMAQLPRVDANPINPELACRKYTVATPITEDKPIVCNSLSQGEPHHKLVQKGTPIIIQVDRSSQTTLDINTSGKTLVRASDPVELIINKLKYLHISDGILATSSQEQLQDSIVPYNGHGMIVPFGGLADTSRKRKPRAKVDLDSETNRVWLLLMGKEGDLGAGGKDADKEKWWEEERRVFQGRVESFIARMRLVQGERRFSPWKGSVVDSVVGVFLTQNVSDHLSSSAFMAMAARFPVCTRELHEDIETLEEFNRLEDDAMKQQEKMLNQLTATQCPGSLNQPQNVQVARNCASSRSLDRSTEVGRFSYSKEGSLSCPHADGQLDRLLENEMHMPVLLAGNSILTEEGVIKTADGASSSQNSVISSQNSSDSPSQTADQIAAVSNLNSQIDDPLTTKKWSFLEAYPSFMELLQMAGTGNFEGPRGGAAKESMHPDATTEFSGNMGFDMRPPGLDGLHNSNDAQPCVHKRTFQLYHEKNDDLGVSVISAPHWNIQLTSRLSGMESSETVRDSDLMQSVNLETTDTNHIRPSFTTSNILNQNITDISYQRWPQSSSNSPCVSGSHKREFTELLTSISNTDSPSNPLRMLNHEWVTSKQQSKTKTTISTNQLNHGNGSSTSPKVTSYDTKLQHVNQNGQNMCGNASNLTSNRSIYSNLEVPVESGKHGGRTTKGKGEKEKKSFDWDSLRRENTNNTSKKERCRDRMDSVDWEAVRNADVREVSSTIRERGMNNMLAERIKGFLDRLVREHGSIDLEWLRDIPPDQAKDYLLSIRGLGLKSVECVRLLTLHNLAFPVDTNVGRICVRLGWVPLQPLPESVQLHLLELYPLLETIQKYIWPRLCKLDQKTLYELHYQMITFGKVFCTKSKPNCNACPMRGECKHFASAFASARLQLPGPEEKRLMATENPIASESISKPTIVPLPVPQLEGYSATEGPVNVINNCEPIIEEPATPEPECVESLETEIEDAFYEDPDEIPVIKLNIEQFTQNLQNIVQGNTELPEGDMSKALVALTPEAASIPQPKLKNVSRLRTEHQVYELPDSHPLLAGVRYFPDCEQMMNLTMDPREPDDPCPYLLAIWTPGETAQSTEPPDTTCSSRDNGKLCDRKTCFACNSVREAQAQKVRGTLLIPCRTAMRGSFPLNGTYFQVNEVFADHSSSLNPIEVPRECIWSLPRRTVYFGTSVPTIFRGLTTEGVQHCFWRGFICVRGFDQKTRAPRPLMARLHFPTSKAMRNKGTSGKADV